MGNTNVVECMRYPQRLNQAKEYVYSAAPDSDLARLMAYFKLSKSECVLIYMKYLKLKRWAEKYGNSNVITTKLFAQFLHVEINPFINRCLKLLESKQDADNITFERFLLFSYNVCATDRLGLVVFAFTLYDLNNNANLEMRELLMLGEETYNFEYRSSSVAKCMSKEQFQKYITARRNKFKTDAVKCQNKRTHSFGIYEFGEFIENHHNVLFPAFTLQKSIQNAICGHKFWSRITKRRLKDNHMNISYLRVEQITQLDEANQVPVAEMVRPAQNSPLNSPARKREPVVSENGVELGFF